MRCELLPRGSVFSMNPIALPTETNTNEHSSEEYNRVHNIRNMTVIISMIKFKITRYTMNMKNVTKFRILLQKKKITKVNR